jgi:hypothetical protein
MHITATRIVSVVLGFLLCGIGTLSYGEPNGVQLAVHCQASAGITQFRITLRNTGSTNTQVVVGINVGNGVRYDADYFVLDVKRDANSAIEQFHPGHGQMNGPAWPWVVPLQAMSEFSFLLPISGFHSLSNGESLKIGDSAIDVRLHYVAPEHWLGRETSAVNRRNVFAGELTTEWLRVPDQCHSA